MVNHFHLKIEVSVSNQFFLPNNSRSNYLSLTILVFIKFLFYVKDLLDVKYN